MCHIKFVLKFIFSALLACGGVSPALSIEKGSVKQPVATSADLLQSHVWYDGSQKRAVWLNPALVAEFYSDPSRSSLFQKRYPLAKARYNRHDTQIWELPVQQYSNRLLNHQKVPGSLFTVYSPVFFDAPGDSGHMRSLPGNVIIYLNPDWNEVRVNDWIASRGFEVLKKLEIKSNVFVLKTGPGLEALKLANALYESGEVIAAFPDWWQETVMR
jgi:hypothetical protein